jgi:alkylation response protein AidB-like acyl-CoA dehydrogenase
MNYDLTQEQQILKDAARTFFTKECPTALVRQMAEDEGGCPERLWRQMAELGWTGILIPEDHGGCGGGFVELAVLLSEMGYACAPGPFFASSVLGALAILEAGTETQKAALLPGIASGERVVTVAWTEASGRYSADGIALEAAARGDGFVLSGTKLFVPDAHVAQTVICAARTGHPSGAPEEGVSLFLLDPKDPGMAIQPLRTMAGDKQFELSLDGVAVSRENLLGEPGEAWPILHSLLKKAAVAKCAEMCGGAQRVLELAVAHVKERVQFGRPVGYFQAVQHHCANMLTFVDTARFMTHQACWRIAQGLSFDLEAAMCKAWVSEAYRQIVALGHQVMGGMGFMEEHDLQLYFKRAKAAELAFGDADFHRERVAREMGL